MNSPRLLVEWEPRWRGLLDSLPGLFSRSAPPQPYEIRGSRNFPRSFLGSTGLHAAVIALLWSSAQSVSFDAVRERDFFEKHTVVFYQDHFPHLAADSGAQRGIRGPAGGRTAYRPSQKVRIDSGQRHAQQVIEAPAVPLRDRADRLRELLVPAAALPRFNAQPSARVPNLPLAVPEAVQPSPQNVTRARLHAPQLPSTAPVPPAPDQLLKSAIAAPNVKVEPVPPAPDQLLRSATAAPNVAVEPVPPAPDLLASTDLDVEVPKLPVPLPPPAREVAIKSTILTSTSVENQAEVARPAGPVLSTDIPSELASALKHGPAMPAHEVAINATRLGRSSGGDVDLPRPPAGVSNGGGTPSALASALSRGPAMPQRGDGSSAGSGAQIAVIGASGNDPDLPLSSSPGRLAASPDGDADSGLGGSGNGAGTGVGKGIALANGPATGRGGSDQELGRGTVTGARDSFDSGRGPGGPGPGEGSARSGAVQVAISGGPSGSVSIPTIAGGAAAPKVAQPTRPLGPRQTPAITVVASPRSGGALNRYGLLRGGKVYTIYLRVNAREVVLQYSDGSGSSAFESELVAPEPLTTELPADLAVSPVVVSCVINALGELTDVRVIEAATAELATRVTSALQGWKFRPVLKGEEAVQVQAVLGFGITTRN